jgi:hypothetical protein
MEMRKKYKHIESTTACRSFQSVRVVFTIIVTPKMIKAIERQYSLMQVHKTEANLPFEKYCVFIKDLETEGAWRDVIECLYFHRVHYQSPR